MRDWREEGMGRGEGKERKRKRKRLVCIKLTGSCAAVGSCDVLSIT